MSANPYVILGIEPDAPEEDIRQAYLALVKKHPPDHDPEGFRRIQEAYDLLRDPYRRFELMCDSINPTEPLVRWLDRQGRERDFVGPQPWAEVFKGQ